MDEDITKRESWEFWREFGVARNWQKELNAFYEEHGYVTNLLGGRKRRAPMTYNELVNSPIQGTGSDIIVDSWNRLSEKYDLGQFLAPWQQAVLNVHDDLTFEVPDSLVDDAIKVIAHEMLDCPFEFSKVVPLEVEVQVGKTWGELEDYGTYTNADWTERYREAA